MTNLSQLLLATTIVDIDTFCSLSGRIFVLSKIIPHMTNDLSK